MEFKQLVYFLHVAESGSFTRAEAQLDVAQSVLSRHIRALEDELGRPLFERTGRGVVLTEAGRRLYADAQEIVERVERARRTIGSGDGVLRGECRVAFPSTVAALLTRPLVEAFKQRAPHGRLVIYELSSASILEWAAEGRIDFGLAHGAPERSATFVTTPVLTERLYLVGPAADGAGDSDPGPVRVRELGAYSLIVPSARQLPRQLVEAELLLAHSEIDIVWEVGSTRAMLELVAAGLGYAILPRNSIDEASGPFRLRPIVEPEMTLTLSSIVPTRRPLSDLGTCVHGLVAGLVPRLASAQ